MLDKLKSIIPEKWKLAAILSISFTSAFMILMYSPLDIYLRNPTAFVVSWRIILPPLVIACLLVFMLLSIILFVLSRNNAIPGLVLFLLCGLIAFVLCFIFNIYPTGLMYIGFAFVAVAVLWFIFTKFLKEKASDVILLILWGVLIGGYIQILFLNNEMTAITGAAPEYSAITPSRLANLIIWAVIALLPLGLWVFLQAKKREYKYEKILVFSVLIISGMQISGLVSTAAAADLPKGYDEDEPKYISYEATLSLSPEENILVFIVDFLDVTFMRGALERYPFIRESLDGFTHYENNLAEYFHNTLPSVTSMLTQHYYIEGQTIGEYWEEAWKQHSYIDTLRENGFTTNLYIDYLTTYGSLNDIRDKTDNLKDIKGIQINTSRFFAPVLRMSFGRLSPYLLKNFFLAPVTPSFGNDIFNFIVPDIRSAQPLIISAESDAIFHNFIRQNEMYSDNSRKVFTFMHLNGAHSEEDHLYGVRKSFMVLIDYFNKMKEIGVYDNSTIIILGDHGYTGVPELTSLLVKPKDSRGDLLTDDYFELSHRYFPASVLDFAGISCDESYISYFDIIGGAAPPVRTVYELSKWWQAWDASEALGTMFYINIYEVSGDASDILNWRNIR